jgi:hypothetical protein
MRPIYSTTKSYRQAWTHGNRIVGVDMTRRRLWVGGQRLHHGTTGIAVAGAALAQLLAGRTSPGRGAVYVIAGGAMVAHDWRDRRVWFELGAQNPGRSRRAAVTARASRRRP